MMYDSDSWIGYNLECDMLGIPLGCLDTLRRGIQYNPPSDVLQSTGSLNWHDQMLPVNLPLGDMQGMHCFHKYNRSLPHVDHSSLGLHGT